MKSKRQDIELLESYINGTLSDEMRSVVDERLKLEGILHDDYKQLLILREGIRAHALEEKLKHLQKIESEWESEKFKGKNGFTWLKATLAVVLFGAILASVYFLRRQDENKDHTIALNDEEFYKYILHRTERSNVMDLDTQRSMAYNLFSVRDFSQARPLLRKMWNDHNDTLSFFYLGITELSLGNRQNACFILLSPVLEEYPKDDLLRFCE